LIGFSAASAAVPSSATAITMIPGTSFDIAPP
jgi:hypothetical protein